MTSQQTITIYKFLGWSVVHEGLNIELKDAYGKTYLVSTTKQIEELGYFGVVDYLWNKLASLTNTNDWNGLILVVKVIKGKQDATKVEDLYSHILLKDMYDKVMDSLALADVAKTYLRILDYIQVYKLVV